MERVNAADSNHVQLSQVETMCADIRPKQHSNAKLLSIRRRDDQDIQCCLGGNGGACDHPQRAPTPYPGEPGGSGSRRKSQNEHAGLGQSAASEGSLGVWKSKEEVGRPLEWRAVLSPRPVSQSHARQGVIQGLSSMPPVQLLLQVVPN
jgi:hypothetical protein